MADNSKVNSQISDTITQLNTALVGGSSAQSMAIVNAVMADTLGMTMHNAVSVQHNSQMIGGASTTSACAKMLSIVGGSLVPGPPGPKGPEGKQGVRGNTGLRGPSGSSGVRGPIGMTGLKTSKGGVGDAGGKRPWWRSWSRKVDEEETEPTQQKSTEEIQKKED